MMVKTAKPKTVMFTTDVKIFTTMDSMAMRMSENKMIATKYDRKKSDRYLG